MNKELQDALQGMEARLAEKLKLPTDVIRKEELDRLVADIIAKAHPVTDSKMVMPSADATAEKFAEFVAARLDSFKQRPDAWTKAKPWTSEDGAKFKSMPGFLRACVRKSADLQMFDPLGGQEKASTDAMTEGTGSSGGFLVPTEFSYEVIRLMNAATVLRRLARLVPLSTWKRTLPRQASSVTIAWVTEFGTKTVTKPAFGQVTQTAKVMAAIIKGSDELFRDSGLNVQQFCAELIAEASSMEEERVGFAGDVSGAGDPFNGIIYASGVVEASMVGAELVYDDLIDLEGSIAEGYSENAQFVFKRDILHVLMKLKDKDGNPIWHSPREGNPGLLLNRRYNLSAQLPTDLGAGGDLSPIILGDFRHLWVSDREGMAVKVSQDASDWVGGALDSAFMSDQTWLRFTRALSVDVMLPQAFAFMNAK